MNTNTKTNHIKTVCVFLSLFFMLFFGHAVRWCYKMFKRINFDEIGIVLSTGATGTDSAILHSFIKHVVFSSIIIALVLLFIWYKFRDKKYVKTILYTGCLVFCVFELCNSNIQLGSFFNLKKSNFYETEYIAPETTKITWPQKRNVLFIALESIEKAYGKEDFPEGVLTPEITKLEKKNISFESYHSMSGLSHTIAAITGFTTGLPLFFTRHKNIEKMIGVNYGIGKIFADSGYQTWSIFPASGKFSLKSNFMRRMGFQHVIDGVEIYSKLKNTSAYRPFGGVDDGVFFDYSKTIITDIVKSGKPYFLFMETINTHLKGYYTDYCRNMGFRQETMGDITKCDDKIITDFVKWFRKTDPNAVIILVNDHKQYSGDLMKHLDIIEDRPLANVFINTNVFKGADLNRPITAMDFFPTVIESAGAKIDGCRLGLGVSLTKRCEKVKTLRERYSDKELQDLMEQTNDLYYHLATGKKR